MSKENTDNRTVQVTGNGVIAVEPDISILTIKSKSVNESAKAARAENATITEKIRKVLVDNGVTAKNIKETTFDFGESYDRKGEKREGFYASGSIKVEIPDISKVSDIFDAVVESGASEVEGPNLSIKEPRPHTDRARKLAYDDALAKGRIYLKEAGGQMLRPIQIVEQNYGYSASNVRRGGKFSNGDETTGNIEVSIAVNVIFEIVG